MSTLTQDSGLSSSSSPPSENSKKSEPSAGCSNSFVLENRILSEDSLDSSVRSEKTSGHIRRMKKLRKELDYLAETAWMYPSIEKILGQN